MSGKKEGFFDPWPIFPLSFGEKQGGGSNMVQGCEKERFLRHQRAFVLTSISSVILSFFAFLLLRLFCEILIPAAQPFASQKKSLP